MANDHPKEAVGCATVLLDLPYSILYFSGDTTGQKVPFEETATQLDQFIELRPGALDLLKFLLCQPAADETKLLAGDEAAFERMLTSAKDGLLWQSLHLLKSRWDPFLICASGLQWEVPLSGSVTEEDHAERGAKA